jgi:3-oxoacyl-[acyl-carrier-protein] synthase-3
LKIGISHIGIYVPEKILTNEDISKMVDTNDEWIFSRTGIKQRHIARKDETTTDMAIASVKDLIDKSSLDIQDVDFIICSTVTNDSQFPSVATLVQKEFKIPNIPTFDVGPACAGFVYVLAIAESFVKSGLAKKVLCICSEKFSDLVDWSDRNTCILFGDASAAFIVEENPKTCTILNTIIGGDGTYNESLQTIKQENGEHFVKMEGTTVFKSAVRIMDDQVRKVCEKSNKSLEDVDLLIPHQANARIMTSVAERLGIKAYMNVQDYGNTSSATIPLALSDAIKEGVITKGDLVVSPALGGGFTWGATLLQF